jgi:hypothetical protein
MSGNWLTYRELADRFGVSVEAARSRALRAGWARQPSNDGKVRIMLPDDIGIEQARTILRFAPELVDQVLARNGITFAAAVREAVQRKAAARAAAIGRSGNSSK